MVLTYRSHRMGETRWTGIPIAVSIIGDYGFAEYGIMGDSFMAVSIIGDSGFAEYDIKGDSFIAVSIVGDSGFAEYGIMGDSIMAVSIIGDSESVFLPLYTKFRYSKVSAPEYVFFISLRSCWFERVACARVCATSSS
jgi:hypothetical protein